MGRLVGDGARTTAATRRAIQESQDSIRSLARRYGIDPKTVVKWRRRGSAADRKPATKDPRSSVLTIEEEAIVVAFRRYIALPLDQSLQGLRAFIPQLTRSSLHRCLQRHGISRRPVSARDRPAHHKARGKAIGHFEISVAEVPTADGIRPVFVAVERGSRFVFAELHSIANCRTAADFLDALIKAAPCRVHAVVTVKRDPFIARSGGGRSAGTDFTQVCALNGIDHSLSDCWTAEQQRRIERAIGEAIEWRRGEGGEALRRKLAAVIAAYNTACKLDVLGGLAPSAYVIRQAAMPAVPQRSSATKARNGTVARPQRSAQKSIADPRPKRRPKDPANTREAILQAARSRLAHDGPEGLSLAEVARNAGVNRGTAYQHFETRDKLITATAEWVSEQLFRAVFGDPEQAANRPVGSVDVAELIDRLANFSMDNPELCRVWLLKVLSSPDPASDLFWRQYQGSTARFAETGLAQDRVDSEVLSVIMLAGAFLWPVWARTKAKASDDLRPLAARFARECLRISMYGNLRSEHYPTIAERLRAGTEA